MAIRRQLAKAVSGADSGCGFYAEWRMQGAKKPVCDGDKWPASPAVHQKAVILRPAVDFAWGPAKARWDSGLGGPKGLDRGAARNARP